MYQLLQTIVDTQTRLFVAGDIDKVVKRYAPVLPVYLGSERMMFCGYDEIGDALARHRNEVFTRGFTVLRGRVAAVSLPRKDRFHVIVDWQYATQSGIEGPESRSVYYCRKTSMGPLIEMLEYPRLAFSEAPMWYADHLEPDLLTGT